MENQYQCTKKVHSLVEQLKVGLKKNINFTVQNTLATKLLQCIFEDMIQMRASKINLQPDNNDLLMYQYIDGILYKYCTCDKNIANTLMLNLKLMAKLETTKKYLPQYGQFSLDIASCIIDIKLSILPFKHGEAAILQFFDNSKNLKKLDDLGMLNNTYARISSLLKKTSGMVFIAASTGQGATTTVYAGLQDLNQTKVKIINIADPHESHQLPALPYIEQRQTNLNTSLNHELCSALTQKPDVVSIGAIQGDKELVDTSLNAATRGHLILATLHAVNTVASVSRLVDMGVKLNLLSMGLHAIIAQHLVRKICTVCRTTYQPNQQEKARFNLLFPSISLENKILYKGAGCAHCHHTGYYDRIGIFEVLILDKALKKSLSNCNMALFKELAQKKLLGYTLQDNLIHLVFTGTTSLFEAQRSCYFNYSY